VEHATTARHLCLINRWLYSNSVLNFTRFVSPSLTCPSMISQWSLQRPLPLRPLYFLLIDCCRLSATAIYTTQHRRQEGASPWGGCPPYFCQRISLDWCRSGEFFQGQGVGGTSGLKFDSCCPLHIFRPGDAPADRCVNDGVVEWPTCVRTNVYLQRTVAGETFLTVATSVLVVRLVAPTATRRRHTAASTSASATTTAAAVWSEAV